MQAQKKKKKFVLHLQQFMTDNRKFLFRFYNTYWKFHPLAKGSTVPKMKKYIIKNKIINFISKSRDVDTIRTTTNVFLHFQHFLRV